MKMIKLSVIAGLAWVMFSSCNKEDGTAKIGVLLHDNTGPYDSVLIDIREVQVHTDASGWMTLHTNAGVYDLLLLQNGIDTAIVPAQSIPVGKLSQIRFVLGSNNRVVLSGASHTLSLSSQDESGLKLNIHQDLINNATYNIMVDFDAEKSVLQNNDGTFKLMPVLNATIQ